MTHQLQYLQLADQIVVMNNGGIEQTGTFQELQTSGIDFMKLLKTIDAENEEIRVRQPEMAQRQSSIVETKCDTEAKNDFADETRETMVKGSMSSGVFLAYFKASKRPFMIAIMILIFAVCQAVGGGSDYFIAFWVNTESSSWVVMNNRTEFLWQGSLPREAMIYAYSAMIVVIVLLWQFQTFVYFGVCMWSSINLHSDMFRSILRATMYFYNTNPTGRILNR